MLPAIVAAQLAAAPAVGLSGSRSALPPPSLAALGQVVAALPPAGLPVVVGCAAGVDQAALSALVAAGGAGRLSVLAAFGPVSPPWPAARHTAPGAWSGSAVAAVAAALFAGASVTWWAGGGPAVPLAGRLAARSIACIRAVATAGGTWCAFPGQACRAGLRPSSSAAACFSGLGSGTWASLALAVGMGLPALIFLPTGVGAPAGWGLVSLGGGWWSAAPPAIQLAMF
jgi:hypothetical protein